MNVRPAPPRADHVVDFLLGPHVDTPHRIVHQDDRGIRPKGAGKQGFLLVAPGKSEDVVFHVGCADGHPLFPFGRELVFPLLSISPQFRGAQGTHRDI